MHGWNGIAPAARNDRHVRRGHLRVRDASARHRAEVALAEALRLVRLPGEEEGRIYFFRRVALRDMPADGDRSVWQERMQVALGACARRALHGADPRAGGSDAVYFDCRAEALEIALGRVARGDAAAEWFWSSAEPAAGRDPQARAAAIVAALEAGPGGSSGVARAVFTAFAGVDPRTIAALFPASETASRLRTMGAGDPADEDAPARRLPAVVEACVARIARDLGVRDPRALWFTALGIAHVAPPGTDRDGARRAGATLRRIVAEAAGGASGASGADVAERGPSSSGRAVAFDEPEAADGAGAGAGAGLATGVRPSRGVPRDAGAGRAEALARGRGAAFDTAGVDRAAQPRPGIGGERTAAAGLFFLLNVMARDGMPAALAAEPELAQYAFAERILDRLAAFAKVGSDDPVRRFLADTIVLREETFGPPPAQQAVRERCWSIVLRRRCRRATGLDLASIVVRSGSLAATRTDVDVTMPLDDADLRIRRAGLDVDPGWLPWFGYVVRFHYRDTAAGEARA